jgi:ElaA protein
VSGGTADVTWRWRPFGDLSTADLYEIIGARERVFVVEQGIPYVDCDGDDPRAWHLTGHRDGALIAYLRAFPPGVRYPEAAFGRVLTAAAARGTGLGRSLTAIGIHRIGETFGDGPIRISAQAYLRRFYEGFGFRVRGDGYIEEGIPHLAMVRPARAS